MGSCPESSSSGALGGNMFGLGSTELVIITVVLVLLFGATRLPAAGKGLGEAIRGFRDVFKRDDKADDTLEKH